MDDRPKDEELKKEIVLQSEELQREKSFKEELKRDTSLQEILEASLGGRGLADGFSLSKDTFDLREWSGRDLNPGASTTEVAAKEGQEIKEDEPKVSEEPPNPTEEKSRVDIVEPAPAPSAPNAPPDTPYELEKFPPHEMASTPCTSCVKDLQPEKPFLPPDI